MSSRTKLPHAAAVAVVAVAAAVGAGWASADRAGGGYEPQLEASDFSTRITNRYFPLPVGRVLTYTGVKDGESVRETVTVTSGTKLVAEGITARVVRDVLTTTDGQLREQTDDFYAQDDEGNVWYLGEETTALDRDGTTDDSGSWEAGVDDAEPGLVMEADPRVPDAYRQELLKGEAEDTAWIVGRGGSLAVPYGIVRNGLISLEATEVEPGSYDQKVYARGLGIVRERSLTSDEHVELVSVTG